MNQHQRKFLLEAVERQYKEEYSSLRERKPKEPSMNNYLIAAILDGSFVMKSADTIREAVVDRVKNLGKDDAFLSTIRKSWSRSGDDEDKSVSIPAGILFEMPPGYATAFAKYEAELASWEAESSALEASINAMRIKVQIGSDKALDALVEQADKLCSMSLTASSNLLLGGPK
jgi:hypothetical protein